MRLKGKVAAITGAGRGIGKTIAKQFLAEGAEIAICDVSEEYLQSAFGELEALGKIIATRVDISSKDQVDLWMDLIMEEYGQLDVLVNNAGIGRSIPFLELTDEILDQVLNVNLKGAIYCSQRAIEQMLGQKNGSIINIGSTNGLKGQPLMAHYNVTKAAIISLTQTLAVEFAQSNIRINSVSPGSIATELNLKDSGWNTDFLEELRQHIPMRRFGSPSEVGATCTFLASDEASYITGQVIIVDGGLLAQQ